MCTLLSQHRPTYVQDVSWEEGDVLACLSIPPAYPDTSRTVEASAPKCPIPYLKADFCFLSYTRWHLLQGQSQWVSFLKGESQYSPKQEGVWYVSLITVNSVLHMKTKPFKYKNIQKQTYNTESVSNSCRWAPWACGGPQPLGPFISAFSYLEAKVPLES